VEANLAEHPGWQLDAHRPWPFEFATVFQEKAESWRSLVAVRSDPATAAGPPGTGPAEQPGPR
jgi:hypothetical protein